MVRFNEEDRSMKQVFRTIALSALVLNLASCLKENEGFAPQEQLPEPFKMTVWADAEATKTVISQDGESFNVNWKAGDKLAVYEVGNGAVQAKATSAALVSGGTTADFTFNLTPELSGPYAYNFVSPASALGRVSDTYAVTVPSAQIFPAGSFDPEADVLVAEFQSSPDTRPTSVTARFARLGGTAKMTIQAPSTTEKVLWITLESKDSLLAGSYFLSPVSGDLDNTPFTGEKSISLYPASETTYDGSFDVWFRTVATTLNKELTVTVQTDAKKYIKRIDLAAAAKTIVFRHGELSKFTVNMAAVAGIVTQVDVFTPENTNSTNSYAFWTKSGGDMPSGASYWGYSMKADGGIQIKSDKHQTGENPNQHTGIVSTLSAGYVKSVTVITTTTSASDGHRVDIYGRDGNYEKADDLWSTGTDAYKKGAKQGSVFQSKEAVRVGTVDFGGNYTGVGIRSYSGAIQASKIFIVWGGEPAATAVVTTVSSSEVDHSSALLSGSYTGATGTISEAGFYWDTSSSDLEELEHPDKVVVAADPASPFGVKLSSLNESTTYYYKAYVLEYDGTSGAYVAHYGAIKSFTTGTKAAFKPGGWLEMPSYTVDDTFRSTTSSLLTDLYPVTHRALLGSPATLQRNYTMLYDPAMYASYWVAYPLCATHMGSGRDEFWSFDPEVPQNKQTDIHKGAYGVKWPTANYANNYFARGHQLPNADRNGATASAMLEQTYYSTNLTPQLQYGFNGDIWKNLEDGVRSCVSGSDTVYVVTGAAFKKVGETKDITTIVSVRDGKTLPVPNYYWKVLLKVKWSGTSVSAAQAIGFWLDHWATYSTASDAYIPCKVSVDQIEAWTGFDFFVNIGDLQTTAETNTDWDAFKAF